MTASYPTTIAPFVTKKDNVDKVVANDVNVLYEEVIALEVALGTGIPTSDWSTVPNDEFTSPAAFSSSVTGWKSLKDRLHNIELGVKLSVTPESIDGGTP